MKSFNSKQEKRDRRRRRIRAKIQGTSLRPRLAVFRSNKAIYVQLVDDESGKTIAAANSMALKNKKIGEKAQLVGLAIALAAKGKQISKAVFDRGGYQYGGAIKELADGARKGGLQF